MFGQEYASIYAKVKSWMPALLRAGDFDEVARFNTAEFINFLKERSIKVEMTSETVSGIEASLKQEGFYFLGSAMRFLSGSLKDFMAVWGKSYEIENLKILTRAIVNHQPIQSLYEPGKYSKIQFELVKDIKGLDELQDYLSGTPYYRLAMDSFPRVKEELSSFYFEMNLDNYYALSLKKKASSLSSGNKKIVRDVFFYYLEMSRIVWIFRAKFHYNFTKEQTISIIPNILGMLSQQHYEQLLESDNEEVFMENLKNFGMIKEDVSDGTALEALIRKNIVRRAKKYLSGSPFNIGVLLGFMILHTVNVRNLTVLLESKKAEIPASQISDMLLLR